MSKAFYSQEIIMTVRMFPDQKTEALKPGLIQRKAFPHSGRNEGQFEKKSYSDLIFSLLLF